MSGFFQRLFGKDNKPAIARGPLGLHLNSGFTLDTLAFRLLEDALLIELPGEEYTVAAVSCIDLGGGSQIFRYYTSGDEFLQINTTGGEDIDDIDDIKPLSMKRATVSVKRVTGARRSTPKRWGQ